MAEALGVAIVTFNSSDVIIDCLETLVAAANADGIRLHIAVLDNVSTDGSAELVESWGMGAAEAGPSDDLPFALEDTCASRVAGKDAATQLGPHQLMVLRAPYNSGFAGGVNRAVAHLMETTDLDRVWILNPDGIVPAGTPGLLARAPSDFGLLGGRTFFHDPPDAIQVDGGRINRRTGVTSSLNQKRRHSAGNPVPFPAEADIDYISGAHLCVSRLFWDKVGPMEEHYFLYYEEVDWAHRRGDLPLKALPEAAIFHRAGTSIGSASAKRRASPMSVYFMNRARHLFMRRAYPGTWPWVWAYSLGKIGQLILQRDLPAAGALLRGAAGLKPPPSVRARLSAEALAAILAPERTS